MSFREGLINIERKWAWSFFGFLLAVIFGGIAIYTSFFQDKRPNLQFIVETKTSVLDLKKDIKNLDILYKGINIKEQHKNLSVITLKVINNSNVTILKEFYDGLSPLKIIVEEADIVDKPQIIETSNKYLKEFLNLELDTSGCVFLPKLIIEGNEYYTISLLLLHKNESKPKIISSGKIAGQINEIEVLENYQSTNEPNFWRKLISGNIWVHLVRFIFYLISFIIIVLAIVIPIALISESISEHKKKKRVKKYKSKKGIENSPETDAVFDLYLDHSLNYLVNTQKLLGNEFGLKLLLRNIERRDKRKQNENIPEIKTIQDEIELNNRVLAQEGAVRPRLNNKEIVARELLRLEMVKYESKEVIINEKFSKELNDFISYLKLI